MKGEVRNVFFDLDHTLWDFEANSTEALLELIDLTNIHGILGKEVKSFIQRYKEINHTYWEMYRKGEMEKAELRIGRFRESLSEFGIENPEIHEAFAKGYIEISPEKTNLFPNAKEVLEYLHEKYPMIIITNGFEEVQWRKIKNCGIDKYFKKVVTSEMAGVRKPHPDIFRYAMGISNSIAPHSVMIGDEPSIDISGAVDVGMHAVFFDPHHKQIPSLASRTIHDLIELKSLL